MTTMADVKLPAGVWTPIPRGTSDPVVVQNAGGSKIVVNVGAAQPAPGVSTGLILQPEQRETLSGLSVGDVIHARPVGYYSGAAMVWA